MPESTPTSSRKKPGRPKNAEKGEIIERLMQAAETLLEQNGIDMTTERNIAAAAGVNLAMIHYYFGSKDKLLAAVLDRFFLRLSQSLEALFDEHALAVKNPMRHIVKVLVETYYERPKLAQAMVTVITRDSVIRDLTRKRYGMKGMTMIRSVLERLVEKGVYAADIDITHIALGLFSIIAAPLAISHVAARSGVHLEELRNDAWIDFIADMFDRQLRPAKARVNKAGTPSARVASKRI